VIKLALMGAGGKMGCRITDNLKNLAKYQVYYVEVSEQGVANLRQRGIAVTPQDEALHKAEVVVLAVPDRLIGRITHDIVPRLQPRSMVIGLDPAAAYAGVMPIRDDLTYFVTHPCHPVLFNDTSDPEKHIDWFGGVFTSQPIVCALHHGPEEDYARGEAIAIDMYGNASAPVTKAHRISVEQMAILEPALAETFSATCITVIREAFEEAVRMGVPRDAAFDFLMGHLRIELAIVFGFAGFSFSDGAKLAIEQARDRIFSPSWKESVMDLDSLRQSVAEITGGLAR
jgi:hypothetical protein